MSTRPDRKIRRPLTMLVGAALCAAGCARFAANPRYAGPTPLPPDVAAYYRYPPQTEQATTEPLEQRRDYRRMLVRFPLQSQGFEPTEPMVEIEWFETTRPGKRPAILFSPILGGDYPLERGVARFFASHGFHVALIHRKTLKVAPEKDADHLELLLRQAIVRNLQVVDWMAAHERVDAARMGSFGISMGGIANVITASVEPRLRCHSIVLAGGSLADILRDSKDKLLTKPRARYLKYHHIDVNTMHQLLLEHLKTDPIRAAPYVDARNLLMFIALNDRTIGRANALRLWRALGKPEVVIMPSGHYTSLLYLPFLKYRSLKFFQRRLSASTP